jgi:hypothetical protein
MWLCVDLLWYVWKWLMNWEQSTAKGYQVNDITTDTKANPSLFTDKVAFQDVKTTRGVATQLKQAGSFRFCLLYSWWKHFCWSLYMILGLLGAISRKKIIVLGFEHPDRNTAHASLVRWSPGFDSSSTALGHSEYFGFPLSLSLHENSIPVNSLITGGNLIRKSHRRAN